MSEESKNNKKFHTTTIQINEITEKTKKSIRVRTITALVIAAVAIPAIIFGDWVFLIFGLLISVLGTYEFIRVLKHQKHPIWIDILTFVMTLTFIYWAMFKSYMQNGELINSSGHLLMSDLTVSTLGFAVLICGLFLGSMLTSKFSVPDVCYYFAMSLFFSLSIQAVYFLRFAPMSSITNGYDYGGNQIPSCLLFIYMVIGCFGSDIGAYYIGILFGKHKMNPRISPNKTWEGFFGGVISSFVLSFTFAMVLSACNIPILKGILDHEHWYWILIISMIMPIVSVIGDFIFSAIKRHYNIKDFSNLLPGHGGILDRIDSLLVTSLFVSILIITIHYFPFVV
ncbi:MAG: hypothetical protein E7177_03405 [Erysipelotrichaceae bacterium]|nr:hypothetical protein [Erysipelotrichaceae bacterium]